MSGFFIEDYITHQKGALKCTLLGGISLQQIDRLRVTLLLERVPKLSPLHSIRQSGLDLYNDNFVEKFGRTAAEKLEVGTTEIRLIIAELIEELEHYRLSKIEAKQEQKPKHRILTKEQREKALTYLKSPNLLKRTGEDIGKSGVVGEEVMHEEIYQPNFETTPVVTGRRIFTISLKEGTIEYELEGEFKQEWY